MLDRWWRSREMPASSFSRRALLKAGSWLAGAAALLAAEGRRASPADASAQGEPLEGSWSAELRRDPRPPGVSFFTFAAGGGMVQTNTDPGDRPAHGAWVKTGEREYDFTWVKPLMDRDGNYIGNRVVQTHVWVDETLDAYTSTAVATEFDLDGNVTDLRYPTARATRIKVLPLPSPAGADASRQLLGAIVQLTE